MSNDEILKRVQLLLFKGGLQRKSGKVWDEKWRGSLEAWADERPQLRDLQGMTNPQNRKSCVTPRRQIHRFIELWNWVCDNKSLNSTSPKWWLCMGPTVTEDNSMDKLGQLWILGRVIDTLTANYLSPSAIDLFIWNVNFDVHPNDSVSRQAQFVGSLVWKSLEKRQSPNHHPWFNKIQYEIFCISLSYLSH